MPKNKLASFRYRVINNCLKNRTRSWTRERLMGAIEEQLDESFGIKKGISRRTFHYDIELMRSAPPRGFDAPIVERNGLYSYEYPDYSIDNIALSETDVESINNAVEILSQFKQLPIYNQLSLIKDKVTGQIFTNSEDEPIIEFESREVKGSEFLALLYRYIKEKSVIRLVYQTFKSAEPKEHELHPYFLKQYNHRWYLIALNEKHGNLGTYSLDRIVSVEGIVGREYDNRLNRDHAAHFEHIIGMTLVEGEEPQEIVARIKPGQAPYVKTKPIHHTQRIIEECEAGLTIAMRIIPNYEFYSTIMSFGSAIEIIRPATVRKEIIKRLREACQMYDRKDDSDLKDGRVYG